MRFYLLALLYILGPTKALASASRLHCSGETYTLRQIY